MEEYWIEYGVQGRGEQVDSHQMFVQFTSGMKLGWGLRLPVSLLCSYLIVYICLVTLLSIEAC